MGSSEKTSHIVIFQMDDTAMESTNALDLSKLDYTEELVNFENIVQLNTNHHKNISENCFKLAKGSHQDLHDYKQLETAIASLLDATEKVDSIKAEVSQKVEQTSVLDEEVKEIQKLLENTMESSAKIAEASRKKKVELDSLKASNNDKCDIVEGRKIELSAELLKWKRTLGLELVNSSHGGYLFFQILTVNILTRSLVVKLDFQKKYIESTTAPLHRKTLMLWLNT